MSTTSLPYLTLISFQLYDVIMDEITSTTTLTDTQPLVLVQLESGNTAAVVYSVSFGEIVVATLLLVLVVLKIVEIWRYQPWIARS